MLTGAPGTGKSTLAGLIQQIVKPLQTVDYGQLLLERLEQRTGSRISYSQLRKLSSDVVSHKDVEKLDADLISELGRLRRRTNVVIDSHAVTRERFGYRITPYSGDQLRKLRLDAVVCLHCDPEVLVNRVQANPGGRPSVSPEEARHHQFLQEAVALVYAIGCGCPLFIVDNTRRSADEVAHEFISVLTKVKARFRSASPH
ncbi:MAG: AAA family ATPase [Acidobacteriia bacterium]|nr:AAA family ATPase [Terriglobia bacterium]